MKSKIHRVICAILGVLLGAGTATIALINRSNAKQDRIQRMSDKHLALFQMMNQWVNVKQEGKNIADYLLRQGYRKIAIYGMSYVGETLIKELQNTEVKICYGIDKNAKSVFSEIEMITPDEELDQVDAIIVTPITFYMEIKAELNRKIEIDCPIISLEDILYEL